MSRTDSITIRGVQVSALLLVLVLLASSSAAATEEPAAAVDSGECSHRSALRQPFFGDLHIHTRYSLDASTQGTRTTPAQAYQFARGQPLGLQPWRDDGSATRSLRLSRPLDFAMVSDHAELFGEVALCNDPDAEGYWSWECMAYRHVPIAAYYLFNYKANIDIERLGFCGEGGSLCLDAARGPWEEMIAAARDFTVAPPDCDFTALVGYEWTGMDASTGGNLHRNVVFNGDRVPARALSFIDYTSPIALWEGLEEQCREGIEGCDALVVPHNSNMSAGLMFPPAAANSNDPAVHALQARYEVLLEIMQHKGSSECFFSEGPGADELCAFEQLPVGSMMGGAAPEPGTGFAREILRQGMLLHARTGQNPYEMGFVASTDTHLGAPGATSERDFPGHGGAGPSARNRVPPGLPDRPYYNPGGLAVLWAEENTPQALFDAMRRREAYGTSGPRIVTRLFGGWELADELCADPAMLEQAYAQAVPMGSVLAPSPADDRSPAFLVLALADPGTVDEPGTPLQRIQIIKSWLDQAGDFHEQVFDVAGDANNGASVDTSTCEQQGSGEANLCAVWRDPTFNTAERAYYYSRVLENPSCRWSQRLCVANEVNCGDPNSIGPGLEACCAEGHRPVIQERAWTSSIFYYPSPPAHVESTE
jgi:hypothetical protein